MLRLLEWFVVYGLCGKRFGFCVFMADFAALAWLVLVGTGVCLS